MRAVGDRMIVAPPLVITRAQIDEMIGADPPLPGPDAGRPHQPRLAALRRPARRQARRRFPLTCHDRTRQRRPTAGAFLQIQNVVKDFDGHRAVDDVTIDIAKGEVFALLGSSGCGKTTLLRMLAGFETPTSGHDRARRPGPRRPAAVRAADEHDVPELRAVPAPHGVGQHRLRPEARRPARGRDRGARRGDAASWCSSAAYAKRKPHQLSGGQQQRVALARSLAKQPQLLLLDEPLGALDKKLREETQIELVNIIEDVGVTCVMVTHDQEEAMTMASRIAVMSEGRFLQVGAPAEIYETPASRFVADFIGNVNLMDGTLVEDEADHCRRRLRRLPPLRRPRHHRHRAACR